MLRCFVVWWNRLIRKNVLLPCCMLSVHSGSWRLCVPPVSCHLHWMWGQLLLVLQCNQGAVGSVSLCLPSVLLTVNQSHWLDIIKYCLLLDQGIGLFHRLVGWISWPSYRGVVQLIVEWHTASLRHRCRQFHVTRIECEDSIFLCCNLIKKLLGLSHCVFRWDCWLWSNCTDQT